MGVLHYIITYDLGFVSAVLLIYFFYEARRI